MLLVDIFYVLMLIGLLFLIGRAIYLTKTNKEWEEIKKENMNQDKQDPDKI